MEPKPTSFEDQLKSDSPDLWNGYDSTQHKGFFDNLGSDFIEFIEAFVVILAIFIVIYWQVARPHKVSGNSMFPTFHNNDYIITEDVSYKFAVPKKGDVIVFHNPKNEADDFIKRVMALPGDTIQIQNNTVFVNGQPVNEYYLKPDVITYPGQYLTEGKIVKVQPGEYFAFGDNREHSSDSREWGPIPKKELIGKAFFRYWPPDVFGFFKALP